MVSSERGTSGLVIVARPNRSASWRTNKLVLLALALPSMGAATGFALAGAWPILPFAGLEMAALGAALYYVNWKLQYRHVITLDKSAITIDKGFYLPRQSWQLQRRDAGLTIGQAASEREGPAIILHDRHEHVRIGDFLGREDSLALINLLRSELRVRAEGPSAKQAF